MKAAVLGFAALLFVPAVAFSDPITITWSNRQATAVTTPGSAAPSDIRVDNQSDNLLITSTSSSLQGTATATAALVSSIRPGNLAGAGTARATVNTSAAGPSGWADAEASSFYEVALNLAQAYDYSFYASFTGDDTTAFDPDGLNVWTAWGAALRNGHSGAYAFNRRDTGSGYVVKSGQLLAGDWQLLLDDYAEAFAPVGGALSAASQYDFTLALTPSTANASPTPEPASLLLLGTGVAALIEARRRRSSAVI